jgi:hypothetical protein
MSFRLKWDEKLGKCWTFPFSPLIMFDLHTQHTPKPSAQSPREIPPEWRRKTYKDKTEIYVTIKIGKLRLCGGKSFRGYLVAGTHKRSCTSRSFCHHLISTHRQRAARRNLSLNGIAKDRKKRGRGKKTSH